MFTCEFAKFLKTPFFLEHFWWLVLYANLNWKYENNSKEKYEPPVEIWTSNESKNKKSKAAVELIKPSCWKNVLHKRHEQLGFRFLILFLKRFKEIESFIFWGAKAHIFGGEKVIVSVPYLTTFGYLPYN